MRWKNANIGNQTNEPLDSLELVGFCRAGSNLCRDRHPGKRVMSRKSLEDILLAIILIAFGLLMMWLLSGCSGAQRTARMKYNSTKNCVWELTGGEVMEGKNVDAEFTVGVDCTLNRKTHSGEELNYVPQ